jgi:hypothetical protein
MQHRDIEDLSVGGGFFSGFVVTRRAVENVASFFKKQVTKNAGQGEKKKPHLF